MRTKLHVSILAATAFAALGATASAQQVPQAPNMSFFVTSAGPGKGGDLGGLAGADAHCQTLAVTAGARNKAWRGFPRGAPTPAPQAPQTPRPHRKGPRANTNGAGDPAP